MTKYKIILKFTCGIISIILLNSCGGGNSEPLILLEEETINSESELTIENVVESSNVEEELQAFDEYIPIDNENNSYQSGDMHINELNLEIKKLQAELDHYKANLRELRIDIRS